MDNRTPSRHRLRRLLLLTLALGAVGCSSIDCEDPTRYIGSALHQPLKVPPDLDQPETSDTFKVPGGAPPKDYPGGACLMKPPQLVAPPPQG